MARLRWRRYRRYRRYPRRFRRRGYRRGRIINRSSRSRVKVNFMGETFVDLGWNANNATSSQLLVSPFYQNVTTPVGNRYGAMFPAALVSQASFLTFASCYEQCRLIGCKVIVTVNTPVGASQNFTDVTMYSTIVRQFSLYDLEHNMLTWPAIGASSSSKRVTFVNNTVNKLGRACYASDLQERIDFVDSQSSYPYGSNLTPRYSDGTALNQQAIASLTCATDVESNVCHPKFCPVFVFQGNTSDVRNNNRTLKLLVRITGTFEFRGPRFGQAASGSAKVAPAADAKIPPPEGGGDMDIVLPDVPSEPTTKRAKLDSDDDDECLPEDERPPPDVPDDEGDERPLPAGWEAIRNLAPRPPRRPKPLRQVVESLMDKNKDGKVDMHELYEATAILRALPKPVLDAAVGIAALDEGDEKPGPIYTERWKDGKVERTYDGKPVDRDPYVYKYGATAAAETLEQAKNESTGDHPEQK